MLAAEAQGFAVHQHQLEAEQIIGGDAVFQAVDAARILGHVAADGAGDLARWIGRVIETVIRHRRCDGQIGDPGLGGHAAVFQIDVEDAVELGEAQGDAVGERQGAAR